jgi:hypothetical protein
MSLNSKKPPPSTSFRKNTPIIASMMSLGKHCFSCKAIRPAEKTHKKTGKIPAKSKK